jgi:NADH-quinone oxidoreductase subunit G
MATTETPLVTVTFDGREINVPAGTPLVVAAAEAGIEIPVFCYEPRLGPPVGACRMCLVEVELGGRPMPKLQAACTMTATDGMLVKTAATSQQARTGQDGVLEFLLLNHPLDCPVCDKGGECPLQDLTFRYGPGASRMTLPKRTYEKPLPISPSIVLDRERCILCYRCTRFSSDVAEDGELIARERGARSVIATFQEQPYTGAFSGNVTELCPVGALLPTPYRFKARPWEIVNVPTVCQGCATGCNTWVTVREGQAERVLSRNHPDVDEGWLCDRGRFARYEPLAERVTTPLVRTDAGLGDVTLGDATRTVAQRLRHISSLHGAGAVASVTGGNLTNEEAYGWSLIARSVRAVTASSAIASDAAYETLDPYAARISDLETADLIVVIGDADAADRAGVVDLRIRKARRRGAQLVIIGCGGTILERDATRVEQTPPGTTSRTLAGLADASHPAATEIRNATHPVVVITDPADSDLVAHAAHALGLHERGGVLVIPTGPNERGARLAGLAGGGDEILDAINAGTVHALVLVGIDPTSDWPDADAWQAALTSVEHVISVAPFVTDNVSWSQIVLPQAAAHERDGTTTNLEGRIQRLRRATRPPAGRQDLTLIAQIGRDLGITIPASPQPAYAAFAAEHGIPVSWDALAHRAPITPRPAAPAAPAAAPTAPAAPQAPADDAFWLVASRSLFAGPDASRTAALTHQRAGVVMLNHADADRLGLTDGDPVCVTHERGEHHGTLRTSRRLHPRTVRINALAPTSGAYAKVHAD